MAKEQFFKWVGTASDVVHSRVSRNEEGVLFSGKTGHIGHTGDSRKIAKFNEDSAFEKSSAKEFKEAGGVLDGNADTEGDEAADEDTSLDGAVAASSGNTNVVTPTA